MYAEKPVVSDEADCLIPCLKLQSMLCLPAKNYTSFMKPHEVKLPIKLEWQQRLDN